MSVLSPTESVCPVCFSSLEARYVDRDGAVTLERTCPEHGAFAPRVFGSAETMRRYLSLFPQPAGHPRLQLRPGHACVAVVDVTDACNLRCSYCFASSSPDLPSKPNHEVLGLLDETLRAAGPIPLQFSGGEPTVRDDLPELLEAARSRGFTHIEVNTNGLRVASEEGYAEALRAAGATALYLQFDGLRSSTHVRIRGADLGKAKERAVAAARAAGLPVLLVSTVVPGINDDEMGDVVRYGLANADVVRGVNFQPVSHFGRYAEDSGHLAMDDAARKLAASTGFLSEADFLPVPCCSALCQTSAVLLRTPAGPVPLTRFVGPALYRTLAAAMSERDYLEIFAGTEEGRTRAAAVATACCVPLPLAAAAVAERAFPVSLTSFMDADSADLRRIRNCCIGVPILGQGVVPFCAYNLTDRAGMYAMRAANGWGGRPRSS